MIDKNPQQAARFIANYGQYSPKVAIVLGSGLSDFASQLQIDLSIPYSQIPGFSACSVAGHTGALILGKLGEVPVACLQGRMHYYEGKSNRDIQIPIRTLKLLGCEILILTNAAASLREELKPGSLAVINDHINFQFHNPLVGPNDELFGPRFPSLQNAYDNQLIALANQTAQELGIKLATGVYLATLGPSYETPAEIRAFRMLGADLVGMSTVSEVIIARHANMKVLAISTITNMACGMTTELLTHEGVLKTAKIAADDLSKLLINFVKTRIFPQYT
jgi:xanthosine phosphorylase